MARSVQPRRLVTWEPARARASRQDRHGIARHTSLSSPFPARRDVTPSLLLLPTSPVCSLPVWPLASLPAPLPFARWTTTIPPHAPILAPSPRASCRGRPPIGGQCAPSAARRRGGRAVHGRGTLRGRSVRGGRGSLPTATSRDGKRASRAPHEGRGAGWRPRRSARAPPSSVAPRRAPGRFSPRQRHPPPRPPRRATARTR